ncbi:PrsW family glutamic-type intramembrane protease [Candidatus Vampirococcus lugosii]|uniref:Uncharacterized protein n=1 Tax=Candidatus Vampirococcus lugosii TaxID=2789015 RepID=A0ABS5QMY9_9BACT|nr:PrsW family glutamic-type intramembrane protease [Candidatus Vampirococcus lugosii]MBS8122548.1 hypothetical protein [Candidatus Vampirococcus lugosii]
MNGLFIIFGILIIALIYWFRKSITSITLKFIILFVISILGGIFSASLLLYSIDILQIQTNVYYSSIFGPFFEELVKFIIVFLIFSVLKNNFSGYRWIATVGILVGLGFGIYENIIYLYSGIDDLGVLFYRSIFIGGIALHPLTSGIFGYMIGISSGIDKIMPKIFKNEKKKFKGIGGIFLMFEEFYYKTKNFFFIILKTIKEILFIDTTIKHIILKSNKTTYGHSPSEIIYEALFLGIWLHILYNSIINYITETNIIILIVNIIIVIILLELFVAIFQSRFFGNMIGAIISLSFVINYYTQAELLLFLSLLCIISVLIIFSWEVNKGINNI